MRSRCYFFILVLICFVNQTISAQQWQWASNYDFPGEEAGSVIGGQDSDGNLYVAVQVARGYVATDYYLLKVSPYGELIWSRNISQYFQARIVTNKQGFNFLCWLDRLVGIDKDGNEIWVKKTDGQRIFGAVFLHENGFIANGKEQVGDSTKTFISAYDENGDLLTNVTVNNHKASLMALDSTENCYFVYPDYPDPVTGNSARLQKYSKTGILNLELVIPYVPTQIISDPHGNVFITGNYGYDPIEINGVKYTVPQGMLERHHFIIKYDSSGDVLWYKIITGSLGRTSMCLDKNGNLYYSIGFSNEINIIGDLHLKDELGNLLVIKFDPDGELLWHHLASSPSSEILNYASPEQCLVNENNEVFISGWIVGAVNFGAVQVHGHSNMYSELFIGKIDQNNLAGLKDQKIPSGFDFLIYPNPSTGGRFQVYFNPAQSFSVNISVSNVQGQKIFESNAVAAPGMVTIEIDASKFPTGVYLLEIVGAKGRAVRKIVRD